MTNYTDVVCFTIAGLLLRRFQSQMRSPESTEKDCQGCHPLSRQRFRGILVPLRTFWLHIRLQTMKCLLGLGHVIWDCKTVNAGCFWNCSLYRWAVHLLSSISFISVKYVAYPFLIYSANFRYHHHDSWRLSWRCRVYRGRGVTNCLQVNIS
jgi:hypothetical protein